MKTRGLTLLELAVSVTIGSIIMMILGGIFLAQARYFAIQDAVSETQIHAFQAADAVGAVMSSAESILSSRTINGTAYATGTGTLVVRLQSIDASGNLVAGSYDYAALGRDPAHPDRFISDLEAAAGTARTGGKHTEALFVDKVIFRYNTVSPTAASAVDFYIRTAKDARGRTIKTPLGKVYYLGTT